MIFNFWKARRAKAIERARDNLLALAQKARMILENVDDRYLSENDRRDLAKIEDLFSWIESDLEAAETHDEMLKAVKEAQLVVKSESLKALIAGIAP